MVHLAVLEFLRGRDDAVLFGAQAVNAYVDEARMTQDVDILSPRAAELAEEIRRYLQERFEIAVRVQRVRQGLGYRIDQVRKPKNRHLVDVRPVEEVPPVERVEDILVVAPAELIASKVLALVQRRGKPKSGTDWRDLAELLLRFPALKREEGPVSERLRASGAPAPVLAAWRDLVAKKSSPKTPGFDRNRQRGVAIRRRCNLTASVRACPASYTPLPKPSGASKH